MAPCTLRALSRARQRYGQSPPQHVPWAYVPTRAVTHNVEGRPVFAWHPEDPNNRPRYVVAAQGHSLNLWKVAKALGLSIPRGDASRMPPRGHVGPCLDHGATVWNCRGAHNDGLCLPSGAEINKRSPYICDRRPSHSGDCRAKGVLTSTRYEDREFTPNTALATR